jgi:paraquat-inducible protein A
MDAPAKTLRIACHECDLLITIPMLDEGARASCPRCGHILAKNTPDGLTRTLALSLAAAISLVFSNLFPFLSLEASGLEQVMTLPQSAYELYLDGYWTIAVLVMGPIMGIPALILATLVALVIPLRRDQPAGYLVSAARFLSFLSPWSMVEVFVIGVLVSLVKIGAMATVILGVSFWAYIAFAFCFIAALTNLDRVLLWRRIEALQA